MRRLLFALAVPAALSAAAAAGHVAAAPVTDMRTATADMKDRSGNNVGQVMLTDTLYGVLLTADLTNLPAGAHGFHIHETGQCEPPFESAGGHFSPDGSKHGFFDTDGKHAGDLPNIHVPDTGELKVEVLATEVTLLPGVGNTLFDQDGSAVVIHAGPDDYRTDPSGDSGDRIACGVVEQK